MKITLYLLILAGFASNAHAGNVDAASGQALEQTKALLTNKEQRDKAVIENSKTKAAHSYAEKVGGSPENVNQMYGISAEIMDVLVSATDGDAQKMQELLEKAKDNPEAWYKSLPAPIQAKIKGLSGRVPGSASSAP